MWVRVTCPNGHRVKIETKYLGRENRCPRCQARVYLWIHVVCSNGHTLRVQSKHAGKTGTCPECKDPVVVPDLTEVIAMETLGDSVLSDGESQSEEAELGSEASKVNPDPMESSILANQPTGPQRVCPGCKSKIPKSFSTCPNCEKFLGAADAIERKASPAGRSIKCEQCGVTSFPGDTFCSSCGSALE